MVRLSDAAGSFGVPVPTTGLAISAYAPGVVAGAPLIAATVARAARRVTLTGLMLASGIAKLATAVSPASIPFAAARFAAGLPHGACFGCAALAAASLAPPSECARAVGRMMLGLSVANQARVLASKACRATSIEARWARAQLASSSTGCHSDRPSSVRA